MTSVETELDRPPRRSRSDRTGRSGATHGLERRGAQGRTGRLYRSGRLERPGDPGPTENTAPGARPERTGEHDRRGGPGQAGGLEQVGRLYRIGGLDGANRFDAGATRVSPHVVFEGTFLGPVTPVPAVVAASGSPRTRSARRRVAARRRRRRRAMNGLAALALAIVATACVTHALGLWQADVVLSGSMRPGIQPGDIEIFRPEPTSSLRVGQILAFHPPRADFAVAHRVIRISRMGPRSRAHGTWIVTKGDANKAADPWGRVRVTSSTVQTVRWVVPKAGWLAYWVGDPWLRIGLMVLAVALAAILVLEWVWRT